MTSGLKVLILLSVAVQSCNKSSTSSVDTSAAILHIEQNRAFVKNVKSDQESDYFISGEFEGKDIYCATTFSDQHPSNDTILNVMYLYSFDNSDQIHLTRFNKENTVKIDVYLEKARLFARPLPYIIPHDTLEECQRGIVTLTNLKNMTPSRQDGYLNEFTFQDHIYDNLKLRVTHFENSVIEGSFEGQLRNNSSSTIRIKNGKFRMKLHSFTINPVQGSK